MKQVPTDEDIQNAVVSVFDKAASVAGPAILGALVPHTFEPIRMVHYVPDYGAQELCHFVNQFNAYLNMTTDPAARTRLRVLIYCHVMEAELPPAIIWNLLRLLVGEQVSWTFYGVSAKGKEIACDEPHKRFTEIERFSVEAGLEMGKVLQLLWHNKLRNAFSHAQYSTFPNGDFVGNRNISPLTSNAVRPIDNDDGSGENPYYYKASVVESLYTGALTWFSVVSEYYKLALTPFKDGSFHQIPTGPIRWSQERGRWVTS